MALIPVETFALALALPWLLAGGYAGPFLLVVTVNLLTLAYLRHRREQGRG